LHWTQTRWIYALGAGGAGGWTFFSYVDAGALGVLGMAAFYHVIFWGRHPWWAWEHPKKKGPEVYGEME
jgi:hypothetical protein